MERNKREVIDISHDELTNEQPAKKSMKREEESVSPQEVAELRQKVAKLEKDKQNLIRIAGEAQSRVEFLEKLIDKKPTRENNEDKLLTELQRKIHSQAEQLVKVDEDRKARWEEFTKQLENARREATIREEELQKKVRSLTEQLEAERSRANEDRIRERERIARLARELIGEDQQQQPIVAVPQPAKDLPKITSKDSTTTTSSHTKSSRTYNSSNIFDVHYTERSYSISIVHSRAYLGEIVTKARGLFGEENEWQERRNEVFRNEKLHCALCKETYEDDKIIEHFFSDEHTIKVNNSARSCRGTYSAYVSSRAFDYWMRKLKSLTKKPTAVDDEDDDDDEDEDDGDDNTDEEDEE